MNFNRSIIKYGLLPAAMLSLAFVASSGMTSNEDQQSFTYLGQLSQKGIPYSGTADVTFTLWDARKGGSTVSATQRMKNITIKDGMFKLPLSFDDAAFAHNATRWLEVSVRAPAGRGSFTTLSPRREVSKSGSLTADNYNQLNSDNENIQLMAPDFFFSAPNSIYLNIDADNDSTDAVLEIAKHRTGDTGGTSLLKVQEDGTVGFGTSTPSNETTLHIRDNTGDNFGVLTHSLDVVGSSIGLHVGPSGYSSLVKNAFFAAPWTRFDEAMGTFALEIAPDGKVGFFVAGPGAGAIPWINSLTLNANGNVGIGTNSPLAQLQVQGSINAQTVRFTGQDGLFRFLQELDASDQASWTFRNGTAGTAVKITTDGNVGIGTTSPTGRLDVAGSIRSSGATGGNFTARNPNNQAASVSLNWLNDVARIRVGGTGSGSINGLDIQKSGNVSLMRLLDNGKVGIGISSPIYQLHVESATSRGVYGKVTATTGNNYGVFGQTESTSGCGLYGYANANSGVNYGVVGRSDSANGFDFYATGAGSNYGASSSRRWKNNVEPIDNPLNKIAQLRGVYYDWDDEHGGQHDVGMIAEEVGEILPEIVTYEENGIDAIGMDYSKMTPLLVEAVNALSAKNNYEIKSLRAEKDVEIDKLRTQNARLESRLTQLEAMMVQLMDSNNP